MLRALLLSTAHGSRSVLLGLPSRAAGASLGLVLEHQHELADCGSNEQPRAAEPRQSRSSMPQRHGGSRSSPVSPFELQLQHRSGSPHALLLLPLSPHHLAPSPCFPSDSLFFFLQVTGDAMAPPTISA
ncbi:hypothetical protein ZWY2020_006062 [Hordeum vulgare]|nr:hypothetical protein ZWY2020_006062 [Hordeum vulgare]